jgi:hypothetical protein
MQRIVTREAELASRASFVLPPDPAATVPAEAAIATSALRTIAPHENGGNCTIAVGGSNALTLHKDGLPQAVAIARGTGVMVGGTVTFDSENVATGSTIVDNGEVQEEARAPDLCVDGITALLKSVQYLLLKFRILSGTSAWEYRSFQWQHMSRMSSEPCPACLKEPGTFLVN